jgi:sRNA-binding carbon storage regulator CsrA
MLALTVKLDHSVKIGDTTVYVVRLKDNGVVLAIDAPPDVPIIRDDAKCREPKHLIDAERGATGLPRFYHSERDGIWFVFDRTDEHYKAGPHYTERQADEFIITMTQAVRPKQ